jgi:uncharacterized protein (DUF2147 family)
MLQSQLKFKLLILFFLSSLICAANQVHDPNAICGKWMSANKDYMVLVYRDGNTFKGKTLWYKNTDNSKSIDEWTDKHNPDPALRSRKLIGLNILRGLTYSASSNTWENGKIYDAQSGKEWSASVQITKTGSLKVTGYWGFKFIGRSLVFNRVVD